MKNHTRTFTLRKWQAIVNGKRSLNGNPYNVTYRGVTKGGAETTAYDVFRTLAIDLQEANADMEHIESLQVTIYTAEE